MEDQDSKPKSSDIDYMLAEIRAARDEELAKSPVCPLKLSWLKQQTKKTKWPMLLAFVLFAMLAYGCYKTINIAVPIDSGLGFALLILSILLLLAMQLYLWAVIMRRAGFACPYCGSGFLLLPGKHPDKTELEQLEESRRCSKCHAIMYDIDT